MSEERFRANFDVSIYDSETEEYISASENGLKEIAKRMNEQQSTIQSLKEENEQLRKENIALDNENAEHLADHIRELELLEKLTKFLHKCNLSNEQRELFREMITEEDLQPKLEVKK